MTEEGSGINQTSVWTILDR